MLFFSFSSITLVLEFWATWCPPCRASIPHLTELAHKYKSAGVEFVGITNEPNETMIKQFVTRMGAQMDYTVAIDSVGKVTEGLQTHTLIPNFLF